MSTSEGGPGRDNPAQDSQFVEVADTIKVTDTLQIGIREYLSLSHIWSACHFARQAHALESADDGHPGRDERHTAAVIASIGAAGDFMDATINELIQDAHDNEHGGPTQHMSPLQRSALAATPPLTTLRWETLGKFDAAATAAGIAPIARGGGVGQDAATALDVKNALRHAVPSTVTTFADDKTVLTIPQIERRLAKLRLNDNVFAGGGQPFFPRRAMTHQLATWCCETAMRYVDEYFLRLAVAAPFDHLRGSLVLSGPP